MIKLLIEDKTGIDQKLSSSLVGFVAKKSRRQRAVRT